MARSVPLIPAVAPEIAATTATTREGYAEVFRVHHDAALRLAYLLCGDPHRAEEAVAEAFAKVWPHWQRGRVADERAYLRRAVVNELRSRARRRAVEHREADRRKATGRGDPTGQEQALERHGLLLALAELPARQRAVVVLRFYEDLSEAAIAEVLGMRPGTVKSQTSRGLARLRQILGEDAR
jgi:RNA polymerase sigma-70 factor (sigma-E family)